MTHADAYPAVAALADIVATQWPEHAGYIAKSLDGRSPADMAVSNDLAECIFKLADHVPGGIDELCRDYRFLCEDIVVPEEIHFRRHGNYRLSSFDEANRECYANAPFMARYMNGLLLSDVLWANHAAAFASFVNDYLPLVADQADHLEIGPGHGLFLYFAARSSRVAKVSGWDVSPTSIAATREALVTLGSPKIAELTLQNLFEAPSADGARLFDSIVMSEILEHLEDPVAALQAAAKYLKPGGTLFVNVPANSPAPDHIFLFNGLDHAVEIVERAGLTVIENKEFPMSGATLERARKHKLSISCVVIARKD